MKSSPQDVERAIELRDQSAETHHLHFICSSYEPEFWSGLPRDCFRSWTLHSSVASFHARRWWEPLECVRRLMMTSANVFIARTGLTLQLIINLSIALLSMKLYSYYSPFVADTDDILSEVAQWILIFSIMITILVHGGVGMNDGGDFTATGVAFVALQLICVIIAGFLSFSDMQEEIAFAKDARIKLLKKFGPRLASLIGTGEMESQIVVIQAAMRGYLTRKRISKREITLHEKHLDLDPILEEASTGFWLSLF